MVVFVFSELTDVKQMLHCDNASERWIDVIPCVWNAQNRNTNDVDQFVVGSPQICINPIFTVASFGLRNEESLESCIFEQWRKFLCSFDCLFSRLEWIIRQNDCMSSTLACEFDQLFRSIRFFQFVRRVVHHHKGTLIGFCLNECGVLVTEFTLLIGGLMITVNQVSQNQVRRTIAYEV
ncbi:hypothetical protein D3C85_1192040 [compost metagenome]